MLQSFIVAEWGGKERRGSEEMYEIHHSLPSLSSPIALLSSFTERTQTAHSQLKMSDSIRRRDRRVGPARSSSRLVSPAASTGRKEDVVFSDSSSSARLDSPRDVFAVLTNDLAVLGSSNHQAVGDGSSSDSSRVREGELIDASTKAKEESQRPSCCRKVISAKALAAGGR